jgi:hypothetical protein
MSKVRDRIDYDYNGTWNEDDAILALEYPVGDLFDDDTYWQDDEDGDEEE